MSSIKHTKKRSSRARRMAQTPSTLAPAQSNQQVEEVHTTSVANVAEDAPVSPAQTALPTTSIADIGAQLQAAREAQGLSIEDVGHKLRLPSRVLRKLESDDLSGINYPIYLRGYLSSYSKLLGVALPSLQTTLEHAALAAPTLTPTGGMSHGRYLLQRYSVAATFLMLTLLIVVPVLVLGLNGGIRHEAARVAPLESAAGATGASSKLSSKPTKSSAEPLMASMVPVGALQKDLDRSTKVIALPVAPPPPTATSDIGAGSAHSIEVQLQAPSWVEITDASGDRLEYGLLRAGNYRYHSDQVLDIRLGNSADATVDVDGTKLDLQPYRRGNVAHFRLDPKTGQPPKASNG